MERSDEGLWEAHRGGDETAFPELIRRHQGMLFGYLMRMTGDRGTAEDLFQETFLRVYSKAGTYRSGGLFKGWLYAIATRIAIDHQRHRQRRPQLEAFPGSEPEEGIDRQDPATETLRREQCAAVQAAVDTLPPKQRATLVLAYYQGYSYPEVAKILGCSLGTVKTQMSRALKTLSTRLPEGGLL